VTTPLVSVIIPAYNASRWIRESINSVLYQTYQDFELIVVDDGSTDSTGKIVHQFHDERIRYIYQENKGLAGARNTGIQASKGEYIGFLDADDLWHPEMLEACISYLEFNPQIDVVRTGFHYIDPDGKRMEVEPEWGPWCGDVLDRLIVNNVFIALAAIIRRRCFEGAGLFDESLRANEDWDLWLRITAAGFQYGFIHKALAMYRRHDSNMTLDYERMRTGALAVLDKIFSQTELKSKIAHLRNEAYANVLVRSCIEALRKDLVKSALNDLALAAEYEKSVINNLSLYYQIACIGLDGSHTPTSKDIDLERGKLYLCQLMEHIDTLEPIKVTPLDRRRAKATVHMALGMIYYSYKSDMQSARWHFAKGIRYIPFSQASWAWLVRTVIGKERLKRIRSLLKRLGWQEKSPGTKQVS